MQLLNETKHFSQSVCGTLIQRVGKSFLFLFQNSAKFSATKFKTSFRKRISNLLLFENKQTRIMERHSQNVNKSEICHFTSDIVLLKFSKYFDNQNKPGQRSTPPLIHKT
jgi:hypothetical protein